MRGDFSHFARLQSLPEAALQFRYGNEDYGGYVISEARRKELIALGFPDDGYDYIAHLKQLGPKMRKPSSRRHVSQVTAAWAHGHMSAWVQAHASMHAR